LSRRWREGRNSGDTEESR
jgi:hypothetical protein